MPHYEVEIEQEVTLRIRTTERAKVVVEADDESDARNKVNKMADEDEITGWKYVDEDSDEDGFEYEILSVKLIPEKFQECRNQKHLEFDMDH